MLTTRQKAFIDEFLTCRNGAEAARRAGYAVPSARITSAQLLTNPNISVELQRIEEQVASNFEMSRDRVIQGLLDGIALAVELKNPQAQIAGWREINKMLGFYKPERHEVKLTGDMELLREKMEAMSDEELLAIAEQDYAG